MKKVLLGLFALATVLGSSPDPVEAHSRCKVRLPMGGWTWGLCTPHDHPILKNPGPRGRTTPIRTYYFKVYNKDRTMTIQYKYAGKYYKLKPGYYRSHSFRGTSKNAFIVLDRYANNSKFDIYNYHLNADLYDLNVYYKGNNLRTYRTDD